MVKIRRSPSSSVPDKSLSTGPLCQICAKCLLKQTSQINSKGNPKGSAKPEWVSHIDKVVAVKAKDLTVPGDVTVAAPCGHLFHRICLRDGFGRRKRLSQQMSCPVCAQPILFSNVVVIDLEEHEGFMDVRLRRNKQLEQMNNELNYQLQTATETCKKLDNNFMSAQKQLNALEHRMKEIEFILPMANYRIYERDKLQSSLRQMQLIQPNLQNVNQNITAYLVSQMNYNYIHCGKVALGSLCEKVVPHLGKIQEHPKMIKMFLDHIAPLEEDNNVKPDSAESILSQILQVEKEHPHNNVVGKKTKDDLVQIHSPVDYKVPVNTPEAVELPLSPSSSSHERNQCESVTSLTWIKRSPVTETWCKTESDEAFENTPYVTDVESVEPLLSSVKSITTLNSELVNSISSGSQVQIPSEQQCITDLLDDVKEEVIEIEDVECESEMESESKAVRSATTPEVEAHNSLVSTVSSAMPMKQLPNPRSSMWRCTPCSAVQSTRRGYDIIARTTSLSSSLGHGDTMGVKREIHRSMKSSPELAIKTNRWAHYTRPKTFSSSILEDSAQSTPRNPSQSFMSDDCGDYKHSVYVKTSTSVEIVNETTVEMVSRRNAKSVSTMTSDHTFKNNQFAKNTAEKNCGLNEKITKSATTMTWSSESIHSGSSNSLDSSYRVRQPSQQQHCSKSVGTMTSMPRLVPNETNHSPKNSLPFCNVKYPSKTGNVKKPQTSCNPPSPLHENYIFLYPCASPLPGSFPGIGDSIGAGEAALLQQSSSIQSAEAMYPQEFVVYSSIPYVTTSMPYVNNYPQELAISLQESHCRPIRKATKRRRSKR